MTVELANESGMEIDEVRIHRLISFSLDYLHVNAAAEVGVTLVDEGAMEELHVRWMDEAGPTDVLSFPMDELRPGTPERPTPPGQLGDIVVCPQVAELQAEKAGHSTMEEILLLTVHGLLHVLGFDHAEPEEERAMFALQGEILVAFALWEKRGR